MNEIMYPENIYVQHHDEIVEICKTMDKDMNDAFIIFDQRHNLKHDDLAQAQYKHWRAVETGADSLLSRPDKKLLGLLGDTEAAD